jgi:hypothetical protein
MGGRQPASAAFHTGKRSGTRYTGGWVSTRAGLDGRGKSAFDSRTVPPLASCYTDYTIPAHRNGVCVVNVKWRAGM